MLAWRHFMATRFRPHRPLPGEVFKVVTRIERDDDSGRWLAACSVGSNMVEPRVCVARMCDSEDEARAAIRAA
jgi:hypothetical protein